MKKYLMLIAAAMVAGAVRVKADGIASANSIQCYYVDATHGADANDGLTWSTAKASIQAAVDVASAGSMILVTNGTYCAIAVPGFRDIKILSVSGAFSTTIDGNNASTVADLNSNNATAASGSCPNRLIGFKLQRGTSGAGGNGAVKGGLAANCVFCNNYGTGYGGGSVSQGGCVFINCIAYQNSYGSSWGGGVFANCLTINCTIVNNTGYGLWDGGVYNCISYGNSQGEYRSSGCYNTYHNCLASRIWDSDLGNITGDPSFRDPDAGDFYLQAGSPCIDTGDSSCYETLTWYDNYQIPADLLETDFFGNPRIVGASVDMGAIEYGAGNANLGEKITVSFSLNYEESTPISRSYYSNSTYWSMPTATRSGYVLDGWYTQPVGGAKVEAGAAVDTTCFILYAHWTDYTTAQRAALDITTDSSLGDNGSLIWTVDTTTYHTGASSLKSATIGNSQSTYQTLTVHGTGTVSFWWKVSSESNYDHLRYYVDSVQQAAISGGTDWQQKTITFTEDCDHIIKWQYDKDGSVSSGSDCGWIDGVEINMDDESSQRNYAVTFYVNAAAGDDGSEGLAVGQAKRSLQSAIDAALDGDTILVYDGIYAPVRTAKKLTIQSMNGAGSSIIDAQGNGQCAIFNEMCSERAFNLTAPTVTLIGFTLRNGNGTDGDGAGVSGGILKRCVICDNEVPGYGSGGAANRSVLYDCLIYNNTTHGNGGACICCLLVNCTVANNSTTGSGDACYGGNAYNSVFYNNRNYDLWGYSNNFEADASDFVNAISNDFRLAVGSRCIDAGDNSRVGSTADLDSNTRIVNGTVDVGCYEYGSRPAILDGLVAWYRFDGNANDSSGNGNDGDVHGATLTEDRFGNANSAYSFNGDDWISVADSQSLRSPRQAFTASVWIKQTAWFENVLGLWGSVLSKCDNSNVLQYGMQLAYHPQGSSYVCYSGTDGYHVGGTGAGDVTNVYPTIKSGEWQHVAVVFDGRHVYAYLDGALAGRINAITNELTLSTSDLYIGVDLCGGDEYFNGAMDDVRIYDRALSAEEVTAVYSDGSIIMPAYHTVTFDHNGGGCSVSNFVREAGAALGDLPVPNRERYAFLGWFTAAEGGVLVSADMIVTSDLTLYAHWAVMGEITIISCQVRTNDASVLDVVYRVNSTNATANVRALAFENGEESFAKVVRPETFVDGTSANLGYASPANTNLTLSWKVTDDWDVKLARVKFMILVEENFYPLPLDLVTIPANGSHRKTTFSTNEISTDTFRDALLWLYADHDETLKLENGVLSAGGVTLANGAELVPAEAARYVFKTMGYSLLEGEVLDYVNETARLNLKSEGAEQHAFKQD